MNTTIDLNSDVGERPSALADGSEEELIKQISSANIACGGHAGNVSSMEALIGLCKRYGVGIGAHPSYPDRSNFGRLELNLSPNEIEMHVFEQLTLLAELSYKAQVRVRHVKPHGALYSAAVKSGEVALAISRAVRRVDNALILLGLAGSSLIELWRDEGFAVAAEAFADRRYEADGSLRSRQMADAIIVDPMEATEQVLRIVKQGFIRAVDGAELPVEAQTVCIHSDTDNALAILKTIRSQLLAEGIQIKPF